MASSALPWGGVGTRWMWEEEGIKPMWEGGAVCKAHSGILQGAVWGTLLDMDNPAT